MKQGFFSTAVRIVFGSIILLAAAVMLIYSLFLSDGPDMAFAMFSVLTLLGGLFLVVFGVDSLKKNR